MLGSNGRNETAIAAFAYLLPVRWTGKETAVIGSLFAISFAVSSIILTKSADIVKWMAETLRMDAFKAGEIVISSWAFAVLGLPALSIFMARNAKTKLAVKKFLENLVILRGIYATLGLLGLVIVIYRNLW